MKSLDSLAIRQPWSALGALIVAAASLSLAGWQAQSQLAAGPDSATMAVSLGLIAVTALTYVFPIYIRHSTKLCLMSVPLFILTALLSPVYAGISVAVATLTGELLTRGRRGSKPGEMVTNTGRWTVLGLLASAISHLAVSSNGVPSSDFLLAASGLFLWMGDVLTLPLALCPMTGERPLRVVQEAARESVLPELGQYTIGLIGVLLVRQQFWALALVVIPTVLVYFATRKQINADTLRLLEGMADTVDARDPHTAGHSKRVADLAAGILRELGKKGQEAQLIVTAARLHDIGKVQLPDHVQQKHTGLTSGEQILVESLPARAAELLSGYPDAARMLDMIRYQHERWDGKGYPSRLRDTDIPFGARVVAVAESFDAMTSERPYRNALSIEQAAQVLRDGRNRQWDATIVDAFLRSIGQPLNPLAEPVSARELVDTSLTARQGAPV